MHQTKLLLTFNTWKIHQNKMCLEFCFCSCCLDPSLHHCDVNVVNWCSCCKNPSQILSPVSWHRLFQQWLTYILQILEKTSFKTTYNLRRLRTDCVFNNQKYKKTIKKFYVKLHAAFYKHSKYFKQLSFLVVVRLRDQSIQFATVLNWIPTWSSNLVSLHSVELSQGITLFSIVNLDR